MRGIADEQADAQFNSSVMEPMVDQAQEMATEGVDDDLHRSNALQSILGQTTPAEVQGGGPGGTMSFMEQLNEQRTGALAEMEGEISMAEEEAKREGRGRVAEFMSKMKEIDSMRTAAKEENRLMAEAEASRRRRSLGSSMLQFGLTAGGMAIGGAPGAAGIGSFAGDVLGGGELSAEEFVGQGQQMEEDLGIGTGIGLDSFFD